MIKNATIPVIVGPRGLDLALNEVNSALTTKLTWLNLAFGKSELLKIYDQNSVRKFPALYVGGITETGYINLLPDRHKGNYCFWKISDGQENLQTEPGNVFLIANFRLIFWLKISDLYPTEHQQKTLENIKAEVNEFFRTTRFSNSVFQIQKFWEETDNIYQGYDHQEIENQFKMRPFAALAIEGRIRYLERSRCFTDQPDLPAWVTPSGQAWIIP